ncbi:MAG: NlpC/P60 family protein [Spirochaetales bacterium]|nr:NlpC/P60 family protein [Spirochaetales bacterium]
MRSVKFLLLLIVSALVFSCATVSYESTVDPASPYGERQEKLVEAAYWMEGRSSLNVGGRSFGLDCTGIVLAAYWYAGIDLAKDFNRYTGNGVKRLYAYLEEEELLYSTDLPAPGDLVFWDNTWDANGNGAADDYYTHVGMIVSLDRETGSGTYLHYNYSKGIVLENINLRDRDNPAMNSPMRMRSLPRVDGYRYLSSQLVRQLGRAYVLEPENG